mgnify:CR=1 FL=1
MGEALWIFVAVLIDGAAVALWLFLISRLDKNRQHKGRQKMLLRFYFLGTLSLPLAWLVYEAVSRIVFPLYGNWWQINIFFYQTLVVGPVEEFSKFLIFFLFARYMKSIKEPKDGILQACTVALAFSSIENFKYGYYFGMDVLIKRFFFATTGHLTYAFIWGAAFSLVYFSTTKETRKGRFGIVYAAIVPAAFLHGMGNFFLYVNPSVTNFLDLLGVIGVLFILRHVRRFSPYTKYPLREYKKALPLLNQALANHPEDFELNFRAGKYNLFGRRYRTAGGHFKICRKQKPKSPSVNLYYGLSLIGDKKFEKGKSILQSKFSEVDEKQKKLINRKLQQFNISRDIENEARSAMGIEDAPKAYRIEKVNRPRYVNRSGVPYKKVLDEKMEEFEQLVHAEEGKGA